jgi:WD repeat-containing protein 68
LSNTTIASNAPGVHGPPSINIQQSAPQNSQYSSSTSALPGALQPGNGPNRPAPNSTNPAPSAVPTLPPIATQPQQVTSSRSGTTNHSHGHSRSSPAGFEQHKYKQYGSTPESAKYSSPPGSGYPPHTPSGAKYSPLGLADIRPPTDTLLMDHSMASGSVPINGDMQFPTNSNYVAPWPIYAADWCKWPMSSGGSFAGKVALGSYLEDGHNYVCFETLFWLSGLLTMLLDSNRRPTPQTTRSRYPRCCSRRRRARICEDGRSNAFLPSDKDIVGTSVLSEAIYRSPCDIGRPFAIMVTTK